MDFVRLPVSDRAVRLNRRVERALNFAVRTCDRVLGRVGLGGREANYDDERYEFVGGPGDHLRRRHYDRSLHLLWKAEEHAPHLPFQDCTDAERSLLDMAVRSLTQEERAARRRLSAPEFRALLDREYTRREKEALVGVLSAIGHGEAYAWIVSAALLAEVKSTGARAALTMQVVEEAKHFIVLRELLQAFDVPIPRQSVWEYLFMEGVLRAPGVERLYGMNVLVEGIALSLFGLLSELPGLEVLRLFHLDESRHTGLPGNYLKEFPLTAWQRRSPLARTRRLCMALPALALMPHLEEDLAVLGIDAFEFGGSVMRKITLLAERNGFLLPVPRATLLRAINAGFNGYCRLTRPAHVFRDFVRAEATRGERELAVEEQIFAAQSASA